MSEMRHLPAKRNEYLKGDFVLEKGIFVNIFEKDIRRVFIYKKSERLAKAIHLIAPAFAESVSLRNRIDAIAIALVDAAVQPPVSARAALSRELLVLSSVLSIARTSGILSAMNVDLIAHESHMLLQEIAAYEEPRIFIDEAPTLSSVARQAGQKDRDSQHHTNVISQKKSAAISHPRATPEADKGHVTDRREGVLSVIRNKGKASIKDISIIIRGVSEKTIQRELQALVEAGTVRKQGERRWSTYELA